MSNAGQQMRPGPHDRACDASRMGHRDEPRVHGVDHLRRRPVDAAPLGTSARRTAVGADGWLETHHHLDLERFGFEPRRFHRAVHNDGVVGSRRRFGTERFTHPARTLIPRLPPSSKQSPVGDSIQMDVPGEKIGVVAGRLGTIRRCFHRWMHVRPRLFFTARLLPTSP